MRLYYRARTVHCAEPPSASWSIPCTRRKVLVRFDRSNSSRLNFDCGFGLPAETDAGTHPRVPWREGEVPESEVLRMVSVLYVGIYNQVNRNR